MRVSNSDRLPRSIHRRLRAKELDGFKPSSLSRGWFIRGCRRTNSTYSGGESPGNLFALARRIGNAY